MRIKIVKKILVILLISLCCVPGYTSKLSKFLNKMDNEQKQRDAQEWQQDMNFGDFVFRLQQRYTDNHGQRCRDYEFRGRSNPYKHGYYTVCDDR
jgi:tyrosyl-tRNA synthetase